MTSVSELIRPARALRDVSGVQREHHASLPRSLQGAAGPARGLSLNLAQVSPEAVAPAA